MFMPSATSFVKFAVIPSSGSIADVVLVLHVVAIAASASKMLEHAIHAAATHCLRPTTALPSLLVPEGLAGVVFVFTPCASAVVARTLDAQRHLHHARTRPLPHCDSMRLKRRPHRAVSRPRHPPGFGEHDRRGAFTHSDGGNPRAGLTMAVPAERSPFFTAGTSAGRSAPAPAEEYLPE